MDILKYSKSILSIFFSLFSTRRHFEKKHPSLLQQQETLIQCKSDAQAAGQVTTVSCSHESYCRSEDRTVETGRRMVKCREKLTLAADTISRLKELVRADRDVEVKLRFRCKICSLAAFKYNRKERPHCPICNNR